MADQVTIYDASLDETRPITQEDVREFYAINSKLWSLMNALREANTAGYSLPTVVQILVDEANARRDAALRQWVDDLPARISSYSTTEH